MIILDTSGRTLFGDEQRWGMPTPAPGYELLFAQTDVAGRQATVVSALADSETATRVLDSEIAWRVSLVGNTVRAVDSDLPDASGQEPSPGGTSLSMPSFVLSRKYADRSLDHLEVVAEFRYYHRLAEDRRRGVLLDFDRSGRENVVAVLHSTYVTVRRNPRMAIAP